MFALKNKLTIYTGGKSAVGGRGLIRLNVVNANSYKPSPPDASYEFPWWNATVYPITNWSGCFLGGTFRVGAGGEVWLTLPDNATKDVTFASRYNNYSADVVPEKYKVNINLTTSTTNANLAYDVPEVCVGQKVTFALTNLPMSQIKDMVGRWKLPTKYVNYKDLTPPIIDTSPRYKISNRLLANTNETSCWFVNGSGTAVSVSVGLNLLFTNGTSVSVAAAGMIKVCRPSVQFSNIPPCVVELNGSILSLESPQFQATAASTNFSGDLNWMQIIKRQAYGNGQWLQNTYGDYYLDNDIFYNTFGLGGAPDHTRVTPQTNGVVHFDDNPKVECVPLNTWINDSFKTYLVFKPDGDSIWVTLGRVDWGWSALASSINLTPPYFGWQLDSSSTTVPSHTDTDEFPVWSNVLRNH